MIGYFVRGIHREDGFALAMSLFVVFSVLALAAIWYSVSLHELDEVTFDRNRTQAVHAADAGAREATYLLANDSTVRSAATGAGSYNSGITSSTCDLVQLTSDGGTSGEYWVQITDATPADTTDYQYFVEGWGWAPDHTRRQANAKKVEFELALIPRGLGFDYAFYAGSLGVTAGNRKDIHGDVYSGGDLNLSNQTNVFDNGSFPGDGNAEVRGNLIVGSGSDTYIEGTTTVNGHIDDDKGNPGSDYIGDVTVLGQNVLPGGHSAYFKYGNFGGVIRLGTTLDSGSNVNGASVVENATGLAEVPDRGMPVFVWDSSDYSPAGAEYATWADFLAYYSANESSLSGAHYVQDTGSYTWNLQNAKFDDDFLLVVDGHLTIQRSAGLTATADTPLTIGVVVSEATGRVTLAQSFGSSEDLIWLIYSEGQFQASQQTTVYGTVYAEEDISSNKLTVFYRPPDTFAVEGFTFTAVTSYSVEPGVWRETPVSSLPCNLP